MKLVNMKKIITLLLAIFATVAFVSCEKAITSEDTDPQKEEEKKPEDNNQNNNDGNGNGNTEPTGAKTLIVYYSYTGNCRAIVSSLTGQIEADVLEIQPAEEGLKYEADNYKIGSALIAAIREKPNDAGSYPGIKEVSAKPEDYDRIIIVTPLWWSNMAAIMQSYLFQSGSKMEGKTIGLIVSSHSSGISDVVKDAKRLVPKGNFYEESLWINNSNHSKRADLIKEWLATNQKTQ